MGGAQQAWVGTPAFELFRRGLITQSVERFRGLNAYTSISALGPEWAQDLLNVIVSGSGGLSKLRLPITKSIAIPGVANGPDSFWDFQQGNGTRQVLAFFGNSLYYYSADLSAYALIENNALNASRWSMAVANNILFGANGQRMQKWGGGGSAQTGWNLWGIAAPTVAPTLGTLGGAFAPFAAVSLTRAANVVTATYNVAFGVALFMPQVGDTIQIINATDASFNGFFTVTAADYTLGTYTYSQIAADAAATATQVLQASTLNLTIAAIGRQAGVVTATLAGPIHVYGQAHAYIAVAGTTGGFDGSFQLTSFPINGITVTWNDPGPDVASSASGGTINFAPTPTQGGYRWAYAYANSVTGHVSNISPVSAQSVAGGAGLGVEFQLTATPPTDPQVDTIYWFRTLDGGGDYYLERSLPLPNGIYLTDTYPDGALDQAIRGPLINDPPILGKYLAVGQGRVAVFNLVGAPQDVAYSGYDQIYLGRPEESFPPNNRLRLSIGAEQIAGGGVLQAGVVAFSQTGRMYMLRGQFEDITLAVPVNFSAYLEELPWTLGCFSHFTVKTTPYGLVWLAGDKTLQLFDGRNEPVDISVGIYPLLRQITPGTESNCVAAYFNWLERDWYVLLCAVNGSLTPNRLFFFAFNKVLSADPTQANTLIESIEMFVSDLPATIMGGVSWIGLIVTSELERMLCIAAQGLIQQLPASSDTVNGLNLDPAIIPPTNGYLNAYWRGGYFGLESPQRSRMWRWARLNTDVDPSAFKLAFRMVDYNVRTFLQPEIIGPRMFKMGKTRMGINNRAARCSVEIDFPALDVSANVVELQVAQIATADR